MGLKKKLQNINNKFEKKVVSILKSMKIYSMRLDPIRSYQSHYVLSIIQLSFYVLIVVLIFFIFDGIIIMFSLILVVSVCNFIFLGYILDYIDDICYSEYVREQKKEFFCRLCKGYKKINKNLLSFFGGYLTYKLVCGHKFRVKLPHIKEYCRICSSELHFGNYPENFPDNFKICCMCLNTAKYIFSDKKSILGSFGRRNRYKKFKDKFDKLFVINKRV